jgi:hypothetical protein
MTDLLAPSVTVMERVITYTPLGIRFWDAARDTEVVDGLVVTARQGSHPERSVRAVATRSGVHAFFGLPGLRSIEHPSDPQTGLASPPQVERYIVDVIDPLRRFVPVAFQVDAPFEGVFPVGVAAGGGAPGGGVPGFFLFPSATATTSAALAVVRADIIDASTDAPASHAVVELTPVGGSRVFGIADNAGRVTLMFPHPRFAPAVLSPPPTPLDARQPPSWAATVRVRFQRAAQASLGPDLPPDLASLFAQPTAPIWATSAGPPAMDLGVTLVLGQETVLRTDGEPRLLVG